MDGNGREVATKTKPSVSVEYTATESLMSQSPTKNTGANPPYQSTGNWDE